MPYSKEAKAALGRLGMGDDHLPDLAKGNPVAFGVSGAAAGTIAVAQLTPQGRLRVGIYIIKNVGGGLADLLTFESNAAGGRESRPGERARADGHRG